LNSYPSSSLQTKNHSTGRGYHYPIFSKNNSGPKFIYHSGSYIIVVV